MSHTEHEAPILRTSPSRMWKMLAIIIGIQIVGGAIFFTHWSYWNSYTPIAGVKQQEWMSSEPDTGCPSIPCPTISQSQTTAAATQGTFTGKPINVSLKFVESSDFAKYGFNAPIGQPDANPEIHANVGDKIIFDVTNGGKSFHAFAITASQKGPGPAIPGTTIGTADNPMKPGENGQVSFVPAQAGEYYYICAVPGHRELGMNGKIEIAGGGGAGGVAGTGATVAPTGNKAEFSLTFTESSDFSKYGFDAPVGDPAANPDIKVKSGDTVTIHIKNGGKSFHAFGIVTDPENPTTIVWNAKFKDPNDPIKPGETGDVTFVAGSPGTYHYICTVPGHAALGMSGNFIVEP